MEKRTPFFLTNLLKGSPQKPELSEVKGWEDTSNDISFKGWGSSSDSASSRPITNGWADEPPGIHYNGWGSDSGPSSGSGSGLLHRPPTQETTSNGWGSGSSCNGWMMDEPLKDEYNGWGSIGKSAISKENSNGWMDELPESEPISNQADIDVGNHPMSEIAPVKTESWAPSAPPLPEENYEHQVAIDSDHSKMNKNKDDDALCVVCWEGPVEGACVPCGHMASCMKCLHEIESKQGTCPICRAKIHKVMRIYAISTK